MYNLIVHNFILLNYFQGSLNTTSSVSEMPSRKFLSPETNKLSKVQDTHRWTNWSTGKKRIPWEKDRTGWSVWWGLDTHTSMDPQSKMATLIRKSCKNIYMDLNIWRVCVCAFTCISVRMTRLPICLLFVYENIVPGYTRAKTWPMP